MCWNDFDPLVVEKPTPKKAMHNKVLAHMKLSSSIVRTVEAEEHMAMVQVMGTQNDLFLSLPQTSSPSGMYYEVFAEDEEGIFWIDSERLSVRNRFNWVVVSFDSSLPLDNKNGHEIIFGGSYEECSRYAEGLNALSGYV